MSAASASSDSAPDYLQALDLSDRQVLDGDRVLRQRVDEPGSDDQHLVHFAFEKEVPRKRRNGPRLRGRRRVAVGELRDQLSPAPGHEL